MSGKRVLLIISGGIAAYKALELIRLLRRQGCGVTCVLTDNGGQFVTPLSLQALSESKVYTDLFSLTDESEMGHIQLSRAADLVVVAPATANILAKMAAGLADDLASTVLLATDKPVLVAPAMNVRMWLHPATQANMATLAAARRPRGAADRRRDGVQRIRPRPPCRTAGNPGGDRGATGAGSGTAGRPACAGDQRPDPRADRSGALHRQPLLRPAGPCHRGGAGRTRRSGYAGLRPGDGARTRPA